MINSKLDERFLKTIDLQNKLNILSAGKQWKLGIAKNGKEINWPLAIYMETAELIDSTDWKWWKHKEDDNLNIKIELVDIFHFILSEIIKFNKDKSLKEIQKFLSNELNKHSTDPILLNYSFIYLTKKLSLHSISLSISDDNYLEHLEKIIHIFKILTIKYFDNIDNMLDLYFAKNILNEFRQKNGYNEKTYKKIWNNVEDNVVMFNLLNDYGLENLNEKLTEVYNKLS